MVTDRFGADAAGHVQPGRDEHHGSFVNWWQCLYKYLAIDDATDEILVSRSANSSAGDPE